jgi:hypothetical protein
MRTMIVLVLIVALTGCATWKGMTPTEQLDSFEAAFEIGVLILNQMAADGKLSDEAVVKAHAAIAATRGALDSLRATIEGGGELDYAAALKAVREALRALSDVTGGMGMRASDLPYTRF